VGPDDPEVGPPTQMAVFTLTDQTSTDQTPTDQTPTDRTPADPSPKEAKAA
jgi:hypothetical protein